MSLLCCARSSTPGSGFRYRTRALLLLIAVVALIVGVLAVPGLARAASPGPGKTLVFGASDNGFEADNAASSLRSLGVPVDRTSSLPEDLSDYSTIWYVSAYDSLSADAIDRLAAFVAAGGSAYLTGERPCCEALNGSVQEVLRAVLKDQDVVVGGMGDIDGPFTFNPAVVGGLSTSPNVLTDFVPQSPGGLSGIGNVSAPNVFASNGSVPVGAAWTDSDMRTGHGRVALLMDIDYLGEDSRLPIIENIQHFLSRGSVCGADTGDLYWAQGSANCSTLTAPLPPGYDTWGVTTVSGTGPIDVQVTTVGVTASCTKSVYPSSTYLVCSLADVSDGGGRLTFTATLPSGETSTRTYSVEPKNDPRNVPVPFRLDSDWWTWPDTDGDGLPDQWESHGVWVRGTFLNLPALGADPRHKDLFLHVDFEAGRELDQSVFDYIQNAFASSPLTNPDGSPGVRLHIERGTSVPSSVVGSFTLTRDDIQRVTTYSGFANSPEVGGDGVPPIYKYILNFAPHSSDGIIGLAQIKGEYGWTAWDVDSWLARLNLKTADAAQAVHFSEASNLMHEFGHELGLNHHGSTGNPNDDPHYKSIMSYAYSNFGLPGALGFNHHIDYSRSTEVNFDWTMGLGVGSLTFVHGQDGEDPHFYADSFNVTVPFDPSSVVEEPTEAERLLDVAPTDLQAFATDFGMTDEADFPRFTDPPTAPVAVTAGQPAAIVLSAADRAGSPISLLVSTAPGHGTVSVTGTTVSYTPAPGYAGPDSFGVRATNGVFASDPLQVAVDVSGADRLPANLVVMSGSGQVQAPAAPFDPLQTLVTDQQDQPVVGVPVTYRVLSGPVSFPHDQATAQVTSGSDGLATSPALVAGPRPGQAIVEASAPGLTPVQFDLTVSPATDHQSADLKVSLSVPATTVRGGTVKMTVTIDNQGPSASNHTVTWLRLPPGFVVRDADGFTRYGSSILVLRGGALKSNQQWSWTFTVVAPRRPVSGRVVAGVYGTIRDPHGRDNVRIATVRVR